MADSRGRILIVDDQEGIRESMAGILELEGYELFTFDDGRKAIAKAAECPIDIAFLDVKMPGINGVDTFLGIKRASPETAVFMMTAYAEEELVRKALEEGACACIHKPFEMERILDIVEQAREQQTLLVFGRDDVRRRKIREGIASAGYRVAEVSTVEDAGGLLKRRQVDAAVLDAAGADRDADDIVAALGGLPGDVPRVVVIGGEAGSAARSSAVLAYDELPETAVIVDALRDLIAPEAADGSRGTGDVQE